MSVVSECLKQMVSKHTFCSSEENEQRLEETGSEVADVARSSQGCSPTSGTLKHHFIEPHRKEDLALLLTLLLRFALCAYRTAATVSETRGDGKNSMLWIALRDVDLTITCPSLILSCDLWPAVTTQDRTGLAASLLSLPAYGMRNELVLCNKYMNFMNI